MFTAGGRTRRHPRRVIGDGSSPWGDGRASTRVRRSLTAGRGPAGTTRVSGAWYEGIDPMNAVTATPTAETSEQLEHSWHTATLADVFELQHVDEHDGLTTAEAE